MPRTRSQSGFSVVEMVVTAAVLVVVASVAVLSLSDVLPAMRADSALQTAMQVLRQARQTAIDQRRTIVVTFSAPAGAVHTVTVQQLVSGTPVVPALRQIPLPSGVQFLADAKLPDPPNTPDNIGNGKVAIDFEDSVSSTPGNQVYFLPDGSAQSAAGNPENGVVYIEQPGYLKFSRAVTLFGATGRIRGWRITQTSPGVWAWQ